jgi:hypothetical protein
MNFHSVIHPQTATGQACLTFKFYLNSYPYATKSLLILVSYQSSKAICVQCKYVRVYVYVSV